MSWHFLGLFFVRFFVHFALVFVSYCNGVVLVSNVPNAFIVVLVFLALLHCRDMTFFLSFWIMCKQSRYMQAVIQWKSFWKLNLFYTLFLRHLATVSLVDSHFISLLVYIFQNKFRSFCNTRTKKSLPYFSKHIFLLLFCHHFYLTSHSSVILYGRNLIVRYFLYVHFVDWDFDNRTSQ